MNWEKILKDLAAARTDADRAQVVMNAGFRSEDEFTKALSQATGQMAETNKAMLDKLGALEKTVLELKRPEVFGDPDRKGWADNGVEGTGNRDRAVLRARYASDGKGGRRMTELVCLRTSKAMDAISDGIRKHVEDGSRFSIKGNVNGGNMEVTSRALSGDTGAAGGFTIGPGDFMPGILEWMYESSDLWSKGTKFNIGTTSWSAPQLVQTFGTSPSFFGGVTWVHNRGQNGTMTEQTNPAYQLRTMQAHDLYGLHYMPKELARDNPSLMTHLMGLLGRAAAFEADRMFWRGTGTDEPLGVLVDGNVSAVTRQTTSRFKVQDYINLDNAITQRSTGLEYFGKKPTYGNLPLDVGSANDHPLVELTYVDQARPANPALRGALNGYPANVSDHMPVLGTAGDVVLMDPRAYFIAVRDDWEFETSTEARFLQRQIAVAITARLDGQLIWPDFAKKLAE